MSPDAQRIAIAEACGWKNFVTETKPAITYLWGDSPGIEGDPDLVPDYLSDLNAMHEAEKMLTPAQQPKYILELDEFGPLGPVPTSAYLYSIAHATAAQRAEAFLRTIGKWTNK